MTAVTFLPGGHVNFNESVITTLKQELDEEIGINNISISSFVGVVESTWIHHKGTFVGDHISFQWKKFVELENINFLPNKISNFLKNYEKYKEAKFYTVLENITV